MRDPMADFSVLGVQHHVIPASQRAHCAVVPRSALLLLEQSKPMSASDLERMRSVARALNSRAGK